MVLKDFFRIIKNKLIEFLFTSKISLYLNPFIGFLVSLRFLNVWEGVYGRWEDAPQDHNVLESKIWVHRITEQAKKDLAVYHSEKRGSLASSTQDYILSLAAGVLTSSTEDDLRVIDFGGGMGASYLPLISSMPDPEKVEFHIVELKTICDLARNCLGEFLKLHFHEKLPKLSKPVHIIHAGSSIQYISDWKGLLKEFANYQPKILILEDLLAGEIPTFITTQNFYGKKVRSRFLNINELIKEVQALGFELTYRSRCTQNFLSKKGGALPMKNFSSQYQLRYGAHLMFRRVES